MAFYLRKKPVYLPDFICKIYGKDKFTVFNICEKTFLMNIMKINAPA